MVITHPFEAEFSANTALNYTLPLFTFWQRFSGVLDVDTAAYELLVNVDILTPTEFECREHHDCNGRAFSLTLHFDRAAANCGKPFGETRFRVKVDRWSPDSIVSLFQLYITIPARS